MINQNHWQMVFVSFKHQCKLRKRKSSYIIEILDSILVFVQSNNHCMDWIAVQFYNYIPIVLLQVKNRRDAECILWMTTLSSQIQRYLGLC